MTTTVGIHRDDIAITIDGKEARTFASQGQQRSAVLSLKLAQLELAGAESGEAPILMLDDVMSELDPSRRRQLIERIDRVQTFVGLSRGKRRADADVSDFWGIAQNRVKTAKNGLIPELSTLVHNLSTISTEVWISLLITCGEAEENPKSAAAAGERAARQKSFGFWLLGRRTPKRKRARHCGFSKSGKAENTPQKPVRAAARRSPFVKGC